MRAKKPSTKPKLTIVPEDAAAAHAFLMERLQEIIAIHADAPWRFLQVAAGNACTADDLRDLDKTLLFLERLKLGLLKELKARGDKCDDGSVPP